MCQAIPFSSWHPGAILGDIDSDIRCTRIYCVKARSHSSLRGDPRNLRKTKGVFRENLAALLRNVVVHAVLASGARVWWTGAAPRWWHADVFRSSGSCFIRRSRRGGPVVRTLKIGNACRCWSVHSGAVSTGHGDLERRR